jgi:hypothetical protein
VQDRVEDHGRGRARERGPTRGHLVEHDAEREEIRPRVQRLSPGLLGGHVGHRSDCGPRAREVLLGRARRHFGARLDRAHRLAGAGLHLREAEVQDHGLPPPGHEDVRRLDVAVDDPLGVGGVESVGELDAEIEQRVVLRGSRRDAVPEGLALEPLHADEGLALVLADVVDGADVRVVEGGSGPGLALESLPGLAVGEQAFREELEGDAAPEPRVLGLVDDAHASAAELPEHAVVGDRPADHVASYMLDIPIPLSRRLATPRTGMILLACSGAVWGNGTPLPIREPRWLCCRDDTAPTCSPP